jgi:hypothetical protein
MLDSHVATAHVIVHNNVSPWYDNPWMIGLVTGIASGIILAVITPILLQKRRAREIAIRRERSAEDILSALRPSVATGNFPSASIVEAIRHASAFNRGLKIKETVPAAELLNVLANEIMASPFVGPEARIATADQLLSLRSELDHGTAAEPAAVERPSVDLATTIVIVGFGAGIFGLVGAIFVMTRDPTLPTIIGTLGVMALIVLASVIGDSDIQLGFGSLKIQMRRFRSPK